MLPGGTLCLEHFSRLGFQSDALRPIDVKEAPVYNGETGYGEAVKDSLKQGGNRKTGRPQRFEWLAL